MLSRKVVTRRGRCFRGYFPSQKLGRMVAWESLLERDAILLLEFSPGVVSYKEQPTVVQYFDGLQLRDYYPDFELALDDGVCIHLEIKPSAELAQPKIAAKYRAIAAHYQERGLTFRLATEQSIRQEPRLTNVRRYVYLRRSNLPLPTIAELTRLLGSDSRPYSVVEDLLGDPALALRLIAAGRLTCDLNERIEGDTVVRVAIGGRDAAVFL